jgi:NAD(P)-dependent dehydrogenase (short-subunit alcohol dehydrogenase family)
MKIQAGQMAVITGGASGIGRALAQRLSAQGVHVAMCDLSAEGLQASRDACVSTAPAGTRVSTFVADVSQESALQAFRDATMAEHGVQSLNLLFNNAGIGGGGSFLRASRAEWERTFGICWQGVYFGCRTFLPLLVAADCGHLVNVSSVNGFWATLGSGVSHTAYSAAKFAVKGFTEALVNDLRLHAPHVGCSVVMPGHIGTSIALNTGQVLGHGSALEMAPESVAAARERMVRMGAPVADAPDDVIRRILHQRAIEFRDNAPTTAEQAADIILEGVQASRWRILVGEDAHRLDAMVRADPESAYTPEFAEAWRDGRKPLV